MSPLGGDPQASPDRFPQLDGLRGCAAVAVLLFHGWMLSAWTLRASDGALINGAYRVLSLGWSGVDVFFTLSAFLLSLPFVRASQAGAPRPDPLAYLRRRIWRIGPAYWLQLLLLGVVFAAVPLAPWPLIAHALLWLNIGAEPVRPLVGVWWTLPVEFGFYLVLPVLALLLRPGRWPWLLLLVVGAWAYRFVVLQPDVPRLLQLAWANHLPGRIDQFVVGMLGAYAWVRAGLPQWLAGARRQDLLALAGLTGFALLHAVPFWLDTRAGPAPSSHPWLLGWHGIASLCLLPLLWTAAAGGSTVLAWLGRPPMRWLGTISYSLYLWHYPIMLAAREHLALLPAGHARPLLFLLCTVPVSLLVAWLSWRLVEAPAMAWARRPRAVPRPRVA
jgi:peptidoglycan/LPS O-acetylase OafA/YrhL